MKKRTTGARRPTLRTLKNEAKAGLLPEEIRNKLKRVAFLEERILEESEKIRPSGEKLEEERDALRKELIPLVRDDLRLAARAGLLAVMSGQAAEKAGPTTDSLIEFIHSDWFYSPYYFIVDVKS